MNKKIILYLVFLISFSSSAQTDTEFWFAAPFVTPQHGNQPVFLRITSYDQPATVTISQPANPGFFVNTFTIPANNYASVLLSDGGDLDKIQNTPADMVLNKGLLITSTAQISVYYEVLGMNNFGGVVNPDIFSLKGKYALGTEFYTPFQTHWANRSGINAWASFDIVATEDNTEVTITPSQDIIGRSANIPFTIFLNRGETYSGRAVSNLPQFRPAGSHIVSSKPIAVTVKDDSVFENPAYDLVGDQIIPVEFTGTEYIVIKTSGNINRDRAFILATQDNTEIFIQGNPISIATINKGQTYNHQLQDEAEYILTSFPVYLFHVTTFNTELGGALLPSLACTGSRDIGFVRVNNDLFGLNILVPEGGENGFTINGNSYTEFDNAFSDVPGTGGAWKFAQIFLSTSLFPANNHYTLSNSLKDYHLGIVNPTGNTGFRYGYFSDFGGLNLGPDKAICEGQTITINAGAGRDFYLWNTGETTSQITVSTAGDYWVTINKGNCEFSDTVQVSYLPSITEDVLGNDTSICSNQEFRINTLHPYFSYRWQNGASRPFYIPDATGYYHVEVANEFGCTKRDTIHVSIIPVPQPVITYSGDPDIFCWDTIITLHADPGHSSYLWFNGETTQNITTTQTLSGEYHLKVVNQYGCEGTASTRVDCSPYISVYNLITPNGDNLNDIFYVLNLRPGTWSLEVYNRWGDAVFYSPGYDNTWNPEDLSDGVYYYHLYHNEGKGNYKGWVQILR